MNQLITYKPNFLSLAFNLNFFYTKNMNIFIFIFNFWIKKNKNICIFFKKPKHTSIYVKIKPFFRILNYKNLFNFFFLIKFFSQYSKLLLTYFLNISLIFFFIKNIIFLDFLKIKNFASSNRFLNSSAPTFVSLTHV